ncbi:hypothetical protein HYDPIDRAFT_168884 [Hydnomerulius pinastri MD-312]|uniref:MYND-type domain-containing protein n=1 Tax=Hydnomerulius pinastri MD-312 TaxID=994086 RepID=A0A0C9WDD6_9AGAM|nr:hypothetical protein HYDPIDRAFT_168884 [Hydnomerulius pinastri MD-312]
MTTDGGLERLVRILHDFCMCPPPPENPNIIYGLSPPNTRPPKLAPTLNPPTFDKHAAYRFSLAFQCVVNIGVRGSEPIRSRVVQAGTLDVVGCILEAWLANKGFAVGPSSSATGLPRESREQRMARRQALAEQRQRDGAAELTRALQRQIVVEEVFRQERAGGGVDATIDEVDYFHRLISCYLPYFQDISMGDVSIDEIPPDVSITADPSVDPIPISVSSRDRPTYDRHSSSSSRETDDTSAETSTNATPGSGTPTGTVVISTRERSGTIIARPVWDEPSGTNGTVRPRPNRTRARMTASPDESTDNSRPETETEDDADADMDQSHDTDDAADSLRAPLPRAPRAPTRSMTQRPRRAVGIISDGVATAPLEMNTDAHIIIHHGQGGAVDGEGVGVVGVEDGIVSLEPNDDFAMGAPPGAPGAMDGTIPTRNLRGVDAPALDRRVRAAPDATPRATVVALPPSGPVNGAGGGTIRGGTAGTARGDHASNPTGPTALGRAPSHVHHHRDSDSGPYKDEDVLLSLQLLAYLSKYPHVRQAFYKQRISFHPAAATLPAGRTASQPAAGPSTARNAPAAVAQPVKESHGFFRAFTSATARGKEKEKAPAASPATPSPRMTNVFSLVERFTFRPSSSESDLPNPPPKLPPEIQYWAGVIMRNACRKDDSRGGIRQCANMLCGRWESYPREFAKCRRCRKAKYCGKECQSTAWSEGHRFWCSAKDGEEAEDPAPGDHHHGPAVAGGVEVAGMDAGATARAERRAERERHARERAGGAPIPVGHVPPPHPNVPPPSTSQAARQRVTALPPTGAQPSPPQATQAYLQMRNRRRAETVSGATTVVGMTPQGRPVYRHEVAWLADGRGRETDEGTGGDAPGPAAHRHPQMTNMIWESSPPGDNDMVLG